MVSQGPVPLAECEGHAAEAEEDTGQALLVLLAALQVLLGRGLLMDETGAAETEGVEYGALEVGTEAGVLLDGTETEDRSMVELSGSQYSSSSSMDEVTEETEDEETEDEETEDEGTEDE